MPNRVPFLLEPYLHLPPEYSLTLFTSVLGASANWLLLHHLSAVLGAGGNKRSSHGGSFDDTGTAEKPEDVSIVLVSFMHDEVYWNTEAKRLMNLDLRQALRKGRFAFVDGLTQLCAPSIGPQDANGPAAPSASACLKTSTLDHFKTTILNTIKALRAQAGHPKPKILLALDSPHILFQTASPGFPVTSPALLASLLQIRSQVHSTLITVPADDPLLEPAAALDIQQDTKVTSGAHANAFMPLETETAAFVVGLVHQCRMVMGCRRLGTGWADDVSGVLRITCGAGGFSDENVDGKDKKDIEVEEGEWLYYIKNDGSVKVWSRGATS